MASSALQLFSYGEPKNVLKINLPLLWGIVLCFFIGPLHFLVFFSQVTWCLAHNVKNDVLLLRKELENVIISAVPDFLSWLIKQIFNLNEYLFG